MEQVLIFANPIAGRGKGRAIAATLEEELVRRGYQTTVFLDRAQSITHLPPPQAIRAAIVIGGDGTLRSVAQWAIDRSLAAAGPGESCVPWPLLIVPMGTANLMGQHLGIAWTAERLPQQVADALAKRRVVHLDVARTAEGIMLLVAGVGFDAWVIHELARLRSGPIHMAHYAMPVLKALTEYRFPSLQVSVDGRCVFDSAPALALVGNIPEYGTGFPVLHQARPDDQLLDVCVMPCATRGDLVKLFLATAAREHDRQEGVVYVKGQHVRIESPQPVAVQVDGEAAGFTPLQVDLLPGRIPFIVP